MKNRIFKMVCLTLPLFAFAVGCSNIHSESEESISRRSPDENGNFPSEFSVTPQVPISRVIATTGGRSMAFDFVPGKGPVWVLIHGLADDMTKLERISSLAARDGHPVLRVDLQGHGRTLTQYLETHPELPEKMDYRDNVSDITSVIRYLKIHDAVIVGHSYGGGIAYSLAVDLQKKNWAKVHSVHLLAPYVQRIDQFWRDQLMSGPFFWRSPRNHARDFQTFRDQWMDPYLETFMRRTYRNYLMEEMPQGNRTRLSADEEKLLDLKVEAAILTTKGIRSLDLLDPSKALPEVGAPLQVLAGENDQLVAPAQMNIFEERLSKQKIPHDLKFMSGESATHLFPRLIPGMTYDLIVKFQKSL